MRPNHSSCCFAILEVIIIKMSNDSTSQVNQTDHPRRPVAGHSYADVDNRRTSHAQNAK